jgi:hypothetical protein
MPLPLLAAAGIVGGASLIGQGISAYGNYKGGKASAEAQRRMAEANKKFAQDNYNTQYGAGSQEAGVRDMGLNSLNDLNALIESGDLYKGYGDYQGQLEFDPSSVDVTQDPGYKFRLQQGQEALDASAAASGGMNSGAQMKALMEYGQNLGSQEFQNAYSRQEGTFNNNSTRKYTDYLTRLNGYNQNLRNQVTDLSSMAGFGERALGRQGAANSAMSGQVMGYNTDIGNANAISAGAPWAAMSGVGQGISNAVQDGMGMYAMGGGFNTATQPSTVQNFQPTGSMANNMDMSQWQTPEQQNLGLNAQGFNTNLFGQTNMPVNAPWMGGIE